MNNTEIIKIFIEAEKEFGLVPVINKVFGKNLKIRIIQKTTLIYPSKLKANELNWWGSKDYKPKSSDRRRHYTIIKDSLYDVFSV